MGAGARLWSACHRWGQCIRPARYRAIPRRRGRDVWTRLVMMMGDGLPVGAYGGGREIMERMSPVGPVYQAGTLSGNPLAMAAGIATLELLRAAPPYAVLAERTTYLVQETERAAQRYGVPVYIT